MKIAPLSIDDLWSRRIIDTTDAHVQLLRDVPVETVVAMSDVEILHHGKDRNFRPYLHLHGVLSSIVPNAPLPFGITELPYRANAGPVLESFYEFSELQLAELVGKGYFIEGFDVPEAMVGIEWELPAVADFAIVSPETMEQDPIVFVSLQDQAGQELDETTSGYDMAEYFPVHTAESPVPTVVARQRGRGPALVGEGRDLFADHDFTQVEVRREDDDTASRATGTDVPVGLFDTLLEEVRRDQLAQQVQEEQTDPVMVEYQQRVASSVDEALRAPAPVPDRQDAPSIAADEGEDMFPELDQKDEDTQEKRAAQQRRLVTFDEAEGAGTARQSTPGS